MVGMCREGDREQQGPPCCLYEGTRLGQLDMLRCEEKGNLARTVQVGSLM